MWVAKIKFSSKGTLIGSKAEKYNLDVFGFPLSYYYEKDHVIVQIAGTLFGSDKDKRAFFKESKREKRVINLEMNGDFVIGTIKEPHYTNDLYQKDIFYVTPAYMSSKGYEVIEIASFKRELLAKIAETFEKRYDGQLLFLGEKKIKSISVMKIQPELTNKQKKAIELAIKNGYYDSPRKIDVKKLAKLSGLSFSTYQVHLRKAEKKLIPYYFS